MITMILIELVIYIYSAFKKIMLFIKIINNSTVQLIIKYIVYLKIKFNIKI